MLGAVLKQILSRLEKAPLGIAQAYENQKKVIGGRGPQLDDIVKMLQDTAGERPMFIGIDRKTTHPGRGGEMPFCKSDYYMHHSQEA